ncbi:MAG: hypothetical protein EA365_15855 [Gloeocapsa sp. DLM2.Bin57]|nr:MAG: hypothetical protein EA365_15855 [Gloeocapsa sp. DLM2.Bin57]
MPRWRVFLYLISQFNFRQKLPRTSQTFWLIVIMVALLCWHWQLLLATLGGVLVMQAIYFFPRYHWRSLISYWESWRSSSHRQFSLAVFGGGVASVVVYFLSSIFAKTDNPWLATGVIFQGLLSIVTCLLLVWQLFTKNNYQYQSNWEQWLIDLTSTEALKRLIAVRELSNLAQRKQLNATELVQLREYLQLMLSVETEVVVRQAILTSLETVFKVNLNIPLQMPLNVKINPFSIYQR